MDTTRYIDIHAHPTVGFYGEDRAAVVSRAHEQKVTVVGVGTTLEDSRQMVGLAEQHDHVFAIVGQHPTNGDPYDVAGFAALATHPRVIGFGETGFDFFRDGQVGRNRQYGMFIEHTRLALEHTKPLMLHIRPGPDSYDAYEAAYDVLAAHVGEYQGEHIANVHFFAGTTQIAQKFLDLGCTISFTGVITFAEMYTDLVRYVPADRILSETDSPYVTPVPYRGKTNEPAYVIEVVRHMARLRGVSEEVMADQIWKNAEWLFGCKFA